MIKINAREIYSAVLLLVISSILLAATAAELSSTYTDAYQTEKGAVRLNTGELFDTLHTVLLIILGFIGGIQIFRKRTSGWVCGTAVLLFYSFLAVYATVALLTTGIMDLWLLLYGIGIAIVLLALIFLLVPSTIKKFRVGIKVIIPTLILFMALLTIFILQ